VSLDVFIVWALAKLRVNPGGTRGADANTRRMMDAKRNGKNFIKDPHIEVMYFFDTPMNVIHRLERPPNRVGVATYVGENH
jgi:hypothetical protein